MNEIKNRVESHAVDGSRIGVVESDAPADGGGFEAILGALRSQRESEWRGAAVRAPAAENGSSLIARVDAARRALDVTMATAERAPSPTAFARLAVLQSDYTLSAQLAIRGIQKSAQALNELSRLQ